MGIKDFLRDGPFYKPPCTPEIRPYDLHEPLSEEHDQEDPLDTVAGALKTFTNTFLRIKSLFDDEESKQLRKGDIIGISRGGYQHYGVYISESSVIHYSSPDSDTSSDNRIIETSLNEFMRGDNTLFKLHFPEKHSSPEAVVANVPAGFAPRERLTEVLEECKDYNLYTPDETVARARSRLGESKYSLLSNNCEHFAIWCKTGISESHQVNAYLRMMRDLFLDSRR